jgi:hypothetical protein
MNPIPIAENALAGAIVELLKLAGQDRRTFEQVFRKVLGDQLKASGNQNKQIIDRAAGQHAG